MFVSKDGGVIPPSNRENQDKPSSTSSSDKVPVDAMKIKSNDVKGKDIKAELIHPIDPSKSENSDLLYLMSLIDHLSPQQRERTIIASNKEEADSNFKAEEIPGSCVLHLQGLPDKPSEKKLLIFTFRGLNGESIECEAVIETKDSEVDAAVFINTLRQKQEDYLKERNKFVENEGDAIEILSFVQDVDFRIWKDSENYKFLQKAYPYEKMLQINRERKIIQIGPEECLLETVDKLDMHTVSKSKKPNIYNKVLIFDLGSGRTSLKIAKRKTAQTDVYVVSYTDLIGIKESKDVQEKLKEINLQSKIYIIGHSNKGCSSIGTSSDKVYTVDQFAEFLNTYCPKLKEKSSEDQAIKITVNACFSGDKVSEEQRSFAEQLHQALKNKGISASVKGYNATIVSTRSRYMTAPSQIVAGHTIVQSEGGSYYHGKDASSWFS